MLRFLFFFLLICSLSGCNEELPDNAFSFNGKIKDIDTGTAILSYTIKSEREWKRVRDTVAITKGKFHFTNFLDEPVLADLSIQDTVLQFFIEPGRMNFEFSKKNPYTFRLTGSKSETDAALLKYETDSAVMEQNKVRNALNGIYRDLDMLSPSSKGYNDLIREKDKYSIQFDSLTHVINKIKLGFIRNNSDSFISAYTLNDLIFEGNIDLVMQKIIFERFPLEIKNSSIGRGIVAAIECQENTEPGAVAPDFTVTDINGKTIRLSDFRGKNYILLDFWAGWCTPCLMALPALKEMYEKYHPRGLEIISISSDGDKEDWLDAVEKNKMNWIQVLNVRNLEDSHKGIINSEDIREKYQRARFSIPVYYFLNKEGRIMAKWYGYAKENELEMEAMMEKIFNR